MKFGTDVQHWRQMLLLSSERLRSKSVIRSVVLKNLSLVWLWIKISSPNLADQQKCLGHEICLSTKFKYDSLTEVCALSAFLVK